MFASRQSADCRKSPQTTGPQRWATPNIISFPIRLISSSLSIYRSIYGHPICRHNQISAPPKSFRPPSVNLDRNQISLPIASSRVRFRPLLNPMWVHLFLPFKVHFGSILDPSCGSRIGSKANSHRIGPRSAPSQLISRKYTCSRFIFVRQKSANHRDSHPDSSKC